MIRQFLTGSMLVAMAAATPALAGVDNYSLIFHVGAPSFSGCADAAVADDALSCSMVDTDANDYGGQPNFFWILVGAVPDGIGGGAPGGIGGIQFGISYNLDVDPSWTLCTGGAEIPQDNPDGTWPGDDTGNAIVWSDGCRLVNTEEGMTRVGFFSVTATTGMMSFIPDPRTGMVEAADCSAESTFLCKALYSSVVDANLDGGGGFSACGISCTNPTRESSWSELKGFYR
jgi:hypothetical protein